MAVCTTIGDLGEFGVIARVTARFPGSDDVILGPGDDAALIAAPDRRVVATTDVLVEGRHFRRDWSAPCDIGHKAVAQNIADLAAMGARPTGLLIGLAAPADLPTAWADAFAEGVGAECAAAGCTVAGGDTVRSDLLTIAVTALGDLGGRSAVRRDGARPGDTVAVCGPLGLSAAGYALLTAGIAPGHDPGAAGSPAPRDAAAEPDWALCLREHRRPGPPYAEGPRAARLGATAMLDVSDGLVQDLGHIARGSGVAIDVETALLHPHPALSAAVSALDAAGRAPRGSVDLMLAGGEDHALAATFPPGTALPAAWVRIGSVREGSGVTVDGRPSQESGWDHFGGADGKHSGGADSKHSGGADGKHSGGVGGAH
ncbi:thiamine-phosphate kinase [Nocardiopsis sediminis]|uniref:Thiamine-monophosphate kinase n=1 Tax=Nocardiopsis sediminis TaxID=1778267 RepID=A0ABV8FWV3_9ACTN